jgi:hypothetical protein
VDVCTNDGVVDALELTIGRNSFAQGQRVLTLHQRDGALVSTTTVTHTVLYIGVPFSEMEAARRAVAVDLPILKGSVRVAACSDGLDNDGDGLADLADRDCNRGYASDNEQDEDQDHQQKQGQPQQREHEEQKEQQKKETSASAKATAAAPRAAGGPTSTAAAEARSCTEAYAGAGARAGAGAGARAKQPQSSWRHHRHTRRF